jgi:hypothetical protein
MAQYYYIAELLCKLLCILLHYESKLKNKFKNFHRMIFILLSFSE